MKKISVFINEILHWAGSIFGISKLQTKTVKQMTILVHNILVSMDHSTGVSLNEKTREHILFVANQAIQDVHDLKLTTEELRSIMDNLTRMYLVLSQQSKSRKQKLDEAKEVADQVLEVLP